MSQRSHQRGHGPKANQATPAGAPGDGRAVDSSIPPDVSSGNGFGPRLLPAISQAVFACDFEGTIVYWNPAAEQFYGWTAEEALGQSILEMITNTAIRSSVADVLTIMRDRHEWVREVTVQRKDGIEFPAQVSLSQIRDDSGTPIGMVAVSADISQRKRAEEALVASEARLRRLEESNLIGIIRAGLDGTLKEANDAFLTMLGYSREELESGLRWDDLTPPEFHEIDEQIMEDLLGSGVSAPKEKEYYRKDGSRTAILLGCARLENAEDDVIAFVLDISARKQAEREREELLAGEQAARVEAADAQHRAEQLLEITAAFSRARTPADVLQATVDLGIAAMGADGGIIALITECGDALEVAQSSGYPPEALDSWMGRPIPVTADFPITDAVLKRETIWIHSREELLERYPALREVPATYSAGTVALPLIADSHVLGALGLSYAVVHEFPPAERVFAETLARFCAQALERTRLFAREQEARREGNAAQRRALGLLRMTAALSRAISPQEVATAAIEHGLGALNVDAGVIALMTSDGSALDVIQTSGYPPDIVDRWHSAPIPIDHPVPIARAAMDGKPIWISNRAEMLNRFPLMRQHSTVFSEAFAAMPLTAGNRTLGILGLSYDTPREISDSDRTYIVTVAQLCSQALERAYLFTAERDARIAAEAVQQRMSVLTEASDLLVTSLDMNDVLPAITRVMVPKMADWCVIDIVGDDGLPERIAVMHTDPEKVRWAAELQSRIPFDPDAPTGVAKVLRMGETEFYPTITDDLLVATARDEEQLELIRKVGFSSALIVPLIARGRTLGAITLVHAESGRHYTGEDLVLTENLAYRAALAVDNARLYAQAQGHADRMDALASVSQAFAEASLDLTTVLNTICHQVAQLVGDMVVIRLPSADGKWLEPVALHHPDPVAETAMRDMFAENPLRWGESVTGQVATTGRSLMIPEASTEELLSAMKPAYRGWTQEFGMHGMLIVPMRQGRTVAGTIAMFRTEPGRPYTDTDRLFVQEIADRAAMAVQNAQLYHEARDAVRLRDEFLSIASHEIRTPMTTITGFAHLLTRQLTQDDIDASRVEMLSNRLLEEAERLNHIVTDLLDVSRIQQGQLALHRESCDLSTLARQVAERLSSAQERSKRRAVIVQAPAPVVGDWDPARLDQVLTNLISNAIKYSTEGDITVRVDVEADDAVIKVVDQGAGIPKDQQERLFEPFVRGDTAHHAASGAGLGLYITRQIVERHQGSIELESRMGAGTTFTVRLPLQIEE